MRRTAGYDRALATQFFSRTINGLLNSPDFNHVVVLTAEVDYMASRLTESTLVPQREGLDSPWFFGNYKNLATMTRWTGNQELLQQAELAANQLLILTGIISNENIWGFGEAKERSQVSLVPDLYRNSARAHIRSVHEAFVLRRMAANTYVWLSLLQRIKGNDLLEMLSAQE